MNLPSGSDGLTTIAALIQQVNAALLQPPQVAVVPAVPAATSYTYVVVAKTLGNNLPTSVSITTGAASLTVSAANTINWSNAAASAGTDPVGLVYDVYRTVGGANQGKIASNILATQNPIMSLVDFGLPGDGTTAPAFNSSGVSTSAVSSTAALTGAITQGGGTVILTGTAIQALTLAAPVAGSPNSGGMDGVRLTITSTTAFAHTITTPTAKLNGLHLATFPSTLLGNSVELVAFNGVWYTVALIGVVIS